MEKVEKYRKICKFVQWGGLGIIIALGIIVIYFFGIKGSDGSTTSSLNTLTYSMGTIMVLFLFMIVVITPMVNHLTKLIILASLQDIVTDVKFNRKKGFTKETFSCFHVANGEGEEYACTDYYSFNYDDMLLESATISSSTTKKIIVNDGKKDKKKKVSVKYFYGRVYVIPFENDNGSEFKVLGRPSTGVDKDKEMLSTEFNQKITLKVKRLNDCFDIYYKEEKPSLNLQKFVDALYTLKLQAKGPVSAIVRKKSIVLCIDNNHHYEEAEFKHPVEESVIRGYKKDVSMVLTFINTLKKEA